MEDRRRASPEIETGTAQTPGSVAPRKRRRTSQVSLDTEGPPTKRTRGDVGKSTPKASAKPTPSVTGNKKHVTTDWKGSSPGGALLQISRVQSGSDVADSEDDIKNYLVEAEPSETKTSENGLDSLEPQAEPDIMSSSHTIHQDQDDENLFDDLQYPPVEDFSSQQHSELGSITSLSQVPSHRVRAANPLIKLADDPNFKGMDGAISVKARLLRQTSPSSGSQAQTRPKPKATGNSKGLQSRKSSLLVFQKGGLTTLKGKYSAVTSVNNGTVEKDDENAGASGMWFGDNNSTAGDIPGLSNGSDCVTQANSPPSGQELLKMAGLNAEAEALPDFEDDAPLLEEPAVQNSSAWQRLAMNSA
jgi:hypothetical protein